METAKTPRIGEIVTGDEAMLIRLWRAMTAEQRAEFLRRAQA